MTKKYTYIKDKEIVDEKSQVFLDLQKDLLHHNKRICEVVKQEYKRLEKIKQILPFDGTQTRPYDIDKQFNEMKHLVNDQESFDTVGARLNNTDAYTSFLRIEKLIDNFEKNYSLQIDWDIFDTKL